MADTKQHQPTDEADEDNVVYQGSEILFENEKEHFPVPYNIQEP